VTRRVRLATLADRDLDELWDYIADNDGSDRASNVVRRVLLQADTLAMSPHIGRARPELEPSCRSFPVQNLIIFYRPDLDGVELLRVLDGCRDIESVWKKSEKNA
jgi:toxin ParE1/3/4